MCNWSPRSWGESSRERMEVEIISEEIRTENLPNLEKDIILQIQNV